MAGAEIRIEVDLARANAVFNRLLAAGSDLTPLMTEIGSALEASTRKRFDEGKGPDGVDWIPLKPATLARKRTARILVERGDLVSSIAFEAGSNYVQLVAGPTEYAAIHQLGGTAGMAPGPAAIPARPYMGLSTEDQEEIADAAEGYLALASRG